MDAIICEFIFTFERDIIVETEKAEVQYQDEEQEGCSDANVPIEYPEEEGETHEAEAFTIQFLEEPVTEYAEGRQLA